MPRYIDADKLTADIIQSYTTNADIYLLLRKILGDVSTEKVVSIEEYNKLKKEVDFIRQYIHDNGLEWDLLSCYTRAEKEGD